MEELKLFFNNSAKKRILKGPQTNGFFLPQGETSSGLDRKEEHRKSELPHGTSYARDIQKQEAEHYLHLREERTSEINQGYHVDSMERLSSMGASLHTLPLTEEATRELYPSYTYNKERDDFDINTYKNIIIRTIAMEMVTIIEGPTGCGKTTQVPQWILDHCYENRQPCNIIVTQPRRIAAISIAKRVGQERGWCVGDLVGYQVGLENKTSTNTKLRYVTTGVLLQKLVSTQNMLEYTHIILDEVHERGQEMDFLLLVVKKLLYTNSSNVKIILMSATFNVNVFANYFKIPTQHDFDETPCISVKTEKPKYSVKTFYLDELNFKGLRVGAIKQDEPSISIELHEIVVKLLQTFDKIDQQEDHYEDVESADLPSVLIFLPGINEIEELYNCLQLANHRTEASFRWWLLPLHSTITADEQARVFARAPPGQRKVILSTNIAESSITVPDIKYVIDYCLMKVLIADPQTNFTSLELQWASKTNCQQRAGRAGRVREGRIYRLVRRDFYENFYQECAPEICRCPLERLVLLSKLLNMGSPKEILALAMDPPDLSNINRTILVLKEIGGLRKTLNGRMCMDDGDLTYLGRIMAKLPVDVRVAKLIMLGYIFGCLEETVVMGAGMTVKNVFSNPFRERLNAYNSKLTWADGSTSDCIALLKVYQVWNHLRRAGYFKNNTQRDWARSFYLQLRSIRELDEMVRELNRRLSREGITAFEGKTPWKKIEMPLLYKVLIAGAFYPNYFVQAAGDEAREREATKMLGGHDPRYTVFLKDFPSNQPGPIYASSIKNIIKKYTGEEPRVTFDRNSTKVFLSFADSRNSANRVINKNAGDPTMPGLVVLPVYKALKIRQLKVDIRVALLPQEKANEIAEALELTDKMNANKNHLVPRLPDLDETHIPIKISQFKDCSHFWAQYDDESTEHDLQVIKENLNNDKLVAYTGTPCVGDLLAAPYEDRYFYRVCVHKVLPRDMVWVFYVDFGTYGQVKVSNLFELPPGICQELPPLAMECTLAEVAPSQLLDVHGKWTQAANNRFNELLANSRRLYAKVYSVAHGVVSVELLADGGSLNINKDLVQKGFAQPMEESYESKLNHDLRVTSTDLNLAQKRAFNQEQIQQVFQAERELEPPSPRDCVTDIYLKGPFSPLEATVHPLMYGSRHKQVGIEWNSVNSVLLDTQPQEVYERLLVAGVVGQNQNGDRLTLRHTTLMPHIAGLPAIITMMFCPTMELRRDESQMRYVCALCGLGCNDEGRPLFPEHDMLVNIDVDLTIEDIGTINHIRHLMDYMMYCREGQDGPDVDDAMRSTIPTHLRRDLMNLLWRPRKHHEGHVVPGAWEWNSVPEEDLLDIDEPSMLQRAVVYPLHSPLELHPLDRETALALKKANEKLKMEVSRTHMSSNKELACPLCNTSPMAAQAMRLHLYSRAHHDREEIFRMYES